MDWKIRNVWAVLCCLSSPLVLANDSSGYFWDFGDGTVSYLAEPEHQYEAAGIYTVKREVYQNGVLVDKSEKVVDLVTPKIVELDITLPQSITEKEQTQLTAKFITSEPLEAIRYQWYVDEQSLGDALSDPVITHVFSDAGTYVVTLNVLWEQTTVRSFEVNVVVEEQNDNTDPDNGGKDPGDGGTDPGDGGTDPDDGKSETPNKSPDQSDGGGSWGIVSLLGLLFLAIRRRR
ncbi:PKD domain-containing protein [Pseudoalteromonas luteoviolacea]|uniref:PKD domain-containing protein n=1 Tax=Pseudoalteromonas luteoviolacea TaxID=43657 RepID=UPI0007B08368|nr:PKD domain-containing protein [Pseudoalteromonas luteoviolacea]